MMEASQEGTNIWVTPLTLAMAEGVKPREVPAENGGDQSSVVGACEPRVHQDNVDQQRQRQL
jgi:hypothetical protein